jgi:hypothetical protein
MSSRARPDRRRLAVVSMALVVTACGSAASPGAAPGSSATQSAPGPAAGTPSSPPATAPRTTSDAPAPQQVLTGWSTGPHLRRPVTGGLMTVTHIVVARHDGHDPADHGLRFDRLALHLQPGAGATAATRIGWDVRHLADGTVQMVLRQAGAWRTEALLSDRADLGLPQVGAYQVAYLNEGADIRLTVTVRRRAPVRVVYLPAAGVVALDVLDVGTPPVVPVAGDVDGDGRRDAVTLPSPGVLRVRYATGRTDDVRFETSPVPGPALLGSKDADRDGRAEVFVRSDSGAATEFATVLRYVDGHLRVMTENGGQSRLGYYGSVRHQFSWAAGLPGVPLVSWSGTSTDGLTYPGELRTYTFSGTRLVLRSSRPYTVTQNHPAPRDALIRQPR